MRPQRQPVTQLEAVADAINTDNPAPDATPNAPDDIVTAAPEGGTDVKAAGSKQVGADADIGTKIPPPAAVRAVGEPTPAGKAEPKPAPAP